MSATLLQYVESLRTQGGCQKLVSPKYSILLVVKLWMWVVQGENTYYIVSCLYMLVGVTSQSSQSCLEASLQLSTTDLKLTHENTTV